MSALVVCAALAGFALLYSLWVPREEVHVPPPPTPLDHLREKKRVIYDNLKDLNFEYRTGKLSDEDYQQLKTSLQYEMAVLMKNIEDLESRAPKTAGPEAKAPGPPPKHPRESGVCSSCGHANPPGHKHCSECGSKLAMALAALLLLMAWGAAPAFGQKVSVEGSIENVTTGKPAAGVPVNLIKAGEFKDPLARAKSDAQGRFRFEPVEQPAAPAMLLVQAEHGGVRYTEPVESGGSPKIALKVFDSGAPASAVRFAERALILQPRSAKLQVTELYMVRNESSPPAAYAPKGPTLRFYVPEAARQSVQATVQGAGGIPVPLDPRPEPGAPGVLGVSHALKPGESRFEVSYHLDYPGSLLFESQAVEKVERTRLAVAQGVTAVGDGVRFIATEPQMKFGIYDIAAGDRWSVKLTGESRAPDTGRDAGSTAGGAGNTDAGAAPEGDSGVGRMPGWVESKLYLFLAGALTALGVGFALLWRQDRQSAVGGRQ